MQEKVRIFKSSWCYSRFLIHFYTQKVAYFVFKDSSSPVKESNSKFRTSLGTSILPLIPSAATYCIAGQTRSKHDQPTLYRRPPRCTPAQHTTCGERDHPRPFFNRLKNLSRSPWPLRAGLTNPRCIWTNIHSPRSRTAHCRSAHFSRAGESGIDRLSGVNAAL